MVKKFLKMGLLIAGGLFVLCLIGWVLTERPETSQVVLRLPENSR